MNFTNSKLENPTPDSSQKIKPRPIQTFAHPLPKLQISQNHKISLIQAMLNCTQQTNGFYGHMVVCGGGGGAGRTTVPRWWWRSTVADQEDEVARKERRQLGFGVFIIILPSNCWRFFNCRSYFRASLDKNSQAKCPFMYDQPPINKPQQPKQNTQFEKTKISIY